MGTALTLRTTGGYTKDMLRQVEPDGSPLLLLRPTLMLTEEQCDFLSWEEIQSCIELRIYVNGKMYPFVLEPVRLSQNQLLVSMVRPGSWEGVYLPLGWTSQSVHLRYEWSLDFARYGLHEPGQHSEISHNQLVILEQKVPSTIEHPLVLVLMDSTNNPGMAISSDLYQLERRQDLTLAVIDQNGDHVVISESINASIRSQAKASA